MSNQNDQGDYTAGPVQKVQEVRYSYRQMMKEVEEERLNSIVGREMIDAIEINQIFSRRRKKIKKS